MGQGVGSSDLAAEVALEVIRRVGLAAVVVGKGGGLVVQLGKGGEDAAIAEGHAVEAGVVGRGVDEGLEDGAGGPLGDGVVELRDAVVAAADQRQNLPGMGVDAQRARPADR